MQVLDTGCRSAAENMAIDHKLLEELDPDGPAILHLYRWEGDCGTYGHFVDPADYLDMEGVGRRGLQLARRPTGGGILFHVCDYAFSVLLPSKHPCFSLNTLENYRCINEAVIAAVGRLSGARAATLLPQEPSSSDRASQHFCMAKPTKYDVMVDGRKIGGAAQRRRRQGLLHQGTIAVASLPQDYLAEVLQPESDVLKNMQAHSYTLLGPDWSPADLESMRCEIASQLQAALADQLILEQSL